VFPLQPRQKKPYRGTNGCKDATTDVTIVERWWSERPDSNIGLATGLVFDVIDLDGPEGEAAFCCSTSTIAVTAATSSRRPQLIRTAAPTPG
jgi:hypothetical protein